MVFLFISLSDNNKYIKGWVRVIIAIVLFFFFGSIFNLFGLIVADVNPNLNPVTRSLEQNLIVSYFNLISIIIVVFTCVKFIDRETFVNVGLKIRGRLKDVLIGISLGVFIMSTAILFFAFFDYIKILDFDYNSNNVLFLALLFINVSFSEEILFRGYILKNFLYSFNPSVALLVSALIFVLFHGLNPNINILGLINLFLAGILLGISYTYTKNLWFPIALHFSWNFFQSLFGFNVSGLNSYSLIEFSITEPNIINGGKFGFEGSILSIIVQLFLILAIFIWYRRKAKREAQT